MVTTRERAGEQLGGSESKVLLSSTANNNYHKHNSAALDSQEVVVSVGERQRRGEYL